MIIMYVCIFMSMPMPYLSQLLINTVTMDTIVSPLLIINIANNLGGGGQEAEL